MIKQLLAIFFIWISYSAGAAEMVVTGVYQGKNVYVQNPQTGEQDVFCTQYVYVNDVLVVSSPSTSAYEVDLSQFDVNENIRIKIIYREGCQPKVINPQVIRPKSKFEFLHAQADNDKLRWFTQGEEGSGKFFVERYFNERWIIIDAVSAKGSAESNTYSIDADHTSGSNRYRVKYLHPNGNGYYSQVMDFSLESDPVTFYPTRVDDKIILSREIPYEVVDAQGNQIAKGVGKEIKLENLTSGLYFLNIDNRSERFIKK